MDIREELAEKIDYGLVKDSHQEICQMAYNLADIVLSKDTLELLKPLYEIDEGKVLIALTDTFVKGQMMPREQYNALSDGDVVGVKK